MINRKHLFKVLIMLVVIIALFTACQQPESETSPKPADTETPTAEPTAEPTPTAVPEGYAKVTDYISSFIGMSKLIMETQSGVEIALYYTKETDFEVSDEYEVLYLDGVISSGIITHDDYDDKIPTRVAADGTIHPVDGTNYTIEYGNGKTVTFTIGEYILLKKDGDHWVLAE